MAAAVGAAHGTSVGSGCLLELLQAEMVRAAAVASRSVALRWMVFAFCIRNMILPPQDFFWTEYNDGK